MTTLSFRDYVLTHSPEDSPAGDFIMDSKHPSQKFPDVKSWGELENWLYAQSACSEAIESARVVWKRYLRAKNPIPVPLGNGLTVRELIEMLKGEDPEAHVISYHPNGKTIASRVLGFSRVSIESGKRTIPAVMLE
jgi:hypothetical protein